MKTKKILVLAVMLITLSSLLFYSCTTSSSIVGSWKSPSFGGKKFNKVVILALHKNIATRSVVERAIVSNLKDNKITAVSGSDMIPESMIERDNDNKVTDKSKEAILQKFKDNNCDGILVIALKNIKESERYVPGSAYYPYAGYSSFHGYYYGGYGAMYSPGYVEQITQVFLVSNLYDVDKGELLWSAQSETYNPSSLQDLANSYSYNLVDEIVRERVMR
jgi:hypothetical protein